VRKIAGIILLAAFALSACKNKDEFTIDGKANNASGIKKVMLYRADQLIDSAFLNDKGEFKFKRNEPDADFYSMAIGEKNFLVIAENGDEINFETDLADSSNTYKIDGSEASEKVREFNQISNKYGKVYLQLQQQYEQALAVHPDSKDSIYNSLMPIFQENMDKFSEEALEFGKKNKDNLAGFYAVGSINDPDKFEPELIKYADDIKTKFPNNKSVQAFVAKMENLKPLSIGKAAPGFELSTPDGKKVSLADYRGKYVLLDFWASWCAPCRQENPNVVKEYAKYKNKGFDILSVSLDDNKENWTKAIKEDNLTWTHVSELAKDPWNGNVARLYKIEAIPYSIVVGPDGKILAKNLRGPALGNFLHKTLD
jgi:peroxiredoxin